MENINECENKNEKILLATYRGYNIYTMKVSNDSTELRYVFAGAETVCTDAFGLWNAEDLLIKAKNHVDSDYEKYNKRIVDAIRSASEKIFGNCKLEEDFTI